MDVGDFIAGWLGGVAGILVGHPLDTVKVNLQTENKMGILGCIMRTLSSEGMRGFYKGMSFPLLSYGAVSGIFFGVYGNTLHYLQRDDNKHSMSSKDIFIAGCLGGLAQLVVCTPVEMVKVKLQSQTGKLKHFQGPVDCIIKQSKHHGMRGCYQGFVIHAIRDVPSYGLQLLMYESFLKYIAERRGHIKSTDAIFAGGFAGILAWAVIMPLDVVKSRIQADALISPKYTGIMDCIVKSYRTNGLPVFGKGFLTMMVRSFPTNAVTFFIYSWSLQLLHSLFK